MVQLTQASSIKYMAEQDNSTSLALPSSVTFQNAAACSRELAKALKKLSTESKTQDINIDLSAVEQFDSSVLAVLLQCRRDALHYQKVLHVLHMPAQLKELCKLYGVQGLLQAEA